MRKIKIIPMRHGNKELEAEVNQFLAEIGAEGATVKNVKFIADRDGSIMSVFIDYDI